MTVCLFLYSPGIQVLPQGICTFCSLCSECFPRTSTWPTLSLCSRLYVTLLEHASFVPSLLQHPCCAPPPHTLYCICLFDILIYTIRYSVCLYVHCKLYICLISVCPSTLEYKSHGVGTLFALFSVALEQGLAGNVQQIFVERSKGKEGGKEI